jgi:hypothetical protein
LQPKTFAFSAASITPAQLIEKLRKRGTWVRHKIVILSLSATDNKTDV